MSNYLHLIERARTALVRKDEQIREDRSLIAELSSALAVKSRDAELGAAIIAAGRWFDIAEAAKELAVELAPDKRLGPNQLYTFLRNTGMLFRKRDAATGWFYHQPKQDQVDAGRMRLQEHPDGGRRAPDGRPVVYRKTLISPAGLVYISKRITEAAREGVLSDLLSE